MNRFRYVARDISGKKVTGKVEAKTINDAARLLREKSLIIIHLAPDNGFFLLAFVRTINNRVGIADVSILTRQLSTMISAGLQITDALVILRAQSKPNLQPVIGQILSDIEGGSSLAAAFEKHPKVFSPVYTSLIRAGETGGVLDKVFSRLADNMESQREFRAQVKNALIYPVIVVIGMIGVGMIMILFVIPKLTEIYKQFDTELPAPTKVLIAISDFSQHFWFLFPILIFGGVFGYRFYKSTEEGKEKIDSLKLRAPISGKLAQEVLLTEFARTLGLMVGAGIPLLDGLKVVSGAMGNTVVSKAIDEASLKIEKGFSLAYALSQNPKIFPPILFQMIAVGEETGKVDETLASVAKVFEQESSYSVKNLTAAVEPIIMLVMGIGVALLAIAVILPIYNLTQAF